MPPSALLPLLAPPCIGAFIGYLTNKIAIRMLFRPLTARRVFGLRVPLTPGIIPAKRHELARSIGEMVGNRLLTGEELGRAVAAAPFRGRLRGVIARQVEVLCAGAWPPLSALVADDAAGDADDGSAAALRRALAEMLAGAINAWLDRPETGEQMAQWLAYAGANADAATLRPLARHLLARTLAAERLGPQLAALFGARLRRAAARGERLRDLLPEASAQALRDLIAAETPGILERIGTELLSPAMRPQLLAALTALARHMLDALGPVGAIAGGFFEADTFERKIDEYLDAHGETLARRLTDPAIRERLAAALNGSLDSLLDRDLADLLRRLPPGRPAELLEVLGKGLAGALASEAARDRLADALTEGLLQGFRAAPGAQPENAGALLALLRGRQGRAFVRVLADTAARECLARLPGQAAARIPQAWRERLADRLTERAEALLAAELPGLAQALGIRDLVRDKVDSLDLLQLERLLLDIMAEQFKYINLFGALLGFLIGLANLLFLLR